MTTMSITLVVLSVGVWFFVSIRHLRIRITQTSQVSGARSCIQVTKHRVVTVTCLHLRDFRVSIRDITKGDGIGWASLLASHLDVTIRDTNIIRSSSETLLLDLSSFDPLRAECALFHDTAHTHSDIWISLHLLKLWLIDRTEWALINFTNLTLIPIEEVKATHLIRAVIRAIASADATVVCHGIQTGRIMHGRIHRANLLTRCIFTVLTHHAHEGHLHVVWHFSLIVFLS